MLGLIATGRLRDSHLAALESEYLKRLPVPWKFSPMEVKTGTPEQEEAFQRAALAKFPSSSTVVLLREGGKVFTSPAFAAAVAKWRETSPALVFVIGGAAGFSAAMERDFPLHLSLGAMTYPHQFARLLLVEQVYRAFTLLSGHPYHKE